MSFVQRILTVTRRQWRDRNRYDRVRDWLASIYSRVLAHKRRWPLPFRGKIHAVHVRGHGIPFYIRIGTSDWYVLDEIFFDGEYQTIADHQLTNIRLIVDLGANAGLSVRLWESLFPDAQIVAAEPDPENYAVAKLNTGERSHLLQVCAAANARKVRLNIGGAEWSRSITDQDGDCFIEVDATTVPDMLKRAEIDGPIDLLKCDIEGAEAEVFGDCLNWINRVRYLVVELHHPYLTDAFLADLKRAGADLKIYKTVSKGFHEILFLERSVATVAATKSHS